MPLNDHRPVFILTGETGSGKTTFLLKLIEELRGKALSLAGFVALSIPGDGPSGSYNILDLVSGKILSLASRKFAKGWKQIGNFYFNPEGIQMGKEILDDPLIINNYLIVFDAVLLSLPVMHGAIGNPIFAFLLDGKVWADSLTHLLSGQNYSVLLVVREQLVSRVMQVWKLEHAMIIEIGQVEPDQVAAAILSQTART